MCPLSSRQSSSRRVYNGGQTRGGLAVFYIYQLWQQPQGVQSQQKLRLHFSKIIYKQIFVITYRTFIHIVLKHWRYLHTSNLKPSTPNQLFFLVYSVILNIFYLYYPMGGEHINFLKFLFCSERFN